VGSTAHYCGYGISIDGFVCCPDIRLSSRDLASTATKAGHGQAKAHDGQQKQVPFQVPLSDKHDCITFSISPSSIADFNFYKPDSSIKPATPLHHQDMRRRHTQHAIYHVI